MTSKQKRGLFLGIFIPLGIVGTAIISFPLIIFILLTISFNWPYHIHRPAVLNQVEDVFKDENGRVYYLANDFLWYFDVSDNKTPHLFDRTDGNGEWLNPRGLIRDDNYFYYFFNDGGSGGHNNDWIKIYDKSFNLFDTIIFPDDMYIYGKCATTDKIYYVLSEQNRLTDDKKDVIPGRRSLYSYDALTKETKLIFEDIKRNTAVEDNGVRLFYSNDYRLQTISEKSCLDNWWDNEKKESVIHWSFADLVDFYFENNCICTTINGTKYSFEIDKRINRFCSNVFLIENKVVFGAYDYIENKDCGNYRNHYCICNQGKSFLYLLDLDTKQLNLMDEYEAGTFLIDYDLDGAKYYYDGGLYINNVFYRECEKIEPGPIEIKRGESYFDIDERKLDYDVSYFDGEFYGI